MSPERLTCAPESARVPVFVGHAEAVHLAFAHAIDADEAREALREAPGVIVIDDRDDGGYVTPIECVGEDAVFVSRIRADPTVANGLCLWVVSDNLRKGAALNAVQIAEQLVAQYLEPVVYRLRAADDGSRLDYEFGNRRSSVSSIGDDVFSRNNLTMRFERDASGAITGFQLDAGRVKNLRPGLR